MGVSAGVGEIQTADDRWSTSGAHVVAGKYHPFASLGRGGMAEVFLAVARGPMGFNKLVVIKRLRDVDDYSQIEMFLDEAKLAARLNHANIVHTYEVGKSDGEYFIAMEYLEGQPLSRLMTRANETHAAIPESVWLKIMCDALTGLHHAHEAADYDGTPLRVVHRDISPQNIFVTYDGDVKIVDFGIAKAALNSRATEEGVLKGKIHYMSPEQALGQAIDRRADVYAAGGVLWELLAGERVMQGDIAAALGTLLHGKVRDLRAVAPHVSAELGAIVKHAMNPVVDARLPTAEAFRSALVEYAASTHPLETTQGLAALMGKLFASDRKQMQARIRDHLARPEPASSSSRLLQLAPESDSAIASAESAAAKDAASHVSIRQDNVPESEPSRRGAPWVKVAIVACAVAVVGYSIASFRHVKLDARGAAPSVATAAVTDTIVEMNIDVTPREATIFLDGVASGQSPFHTSVRKDGALHEVRASAPGFMTHVRTLSFDRSVNLQIALERSPQPPPAPSAQATTPAAQAAPHRAASAANGVPAPSSGPASLPASSADRPKLKLRTER
jgi:serine/threonine protein kinase